MIKQGLLLVALCVVLLYVMPYAQVGMDYLLQAHDWIFEALTEVFSAGKSGNLARSLIAEISIPVLVSCVPLILYWILKREWFPYFMEFVWVVWLIQAGALIAMT